MSIDVAETQSRMQSMRDKIAWILSWVGLGVGPLALLLFLTLSLGQRDSAEVSAPESARPAKLSVWENLRLGAYVRRTGMKEDAKGASKTHGQVAADIDASATATNAST